MILFPLLTSANPYFQIQVVDDQTGRGVPLVELRTVNQMRFFTDSSGRVAFHEPGLMDGREVYFHLSSPGYEIPADGFGYRGQRLKPAAGKTVTIRIHRTQVAERLFRLTGQGIYRDTELLGLRPEQANLNAGILGQDTAQAEVFRGEILWFWGDTDRAGYPLGNFHTTGAVAKVGRTGAEGGIQFHYFKSGDFVRPMVDSKESNPIWISGLAVVDDALYAYYAQMKSLGDVKSSGYLRWSTTKRQFDIVQTFEKGREWRYLDGHTIRHQGYLYGNNPPNVRVRADAKSLMDPAAYEAFTCLDGNGKVLRVNGKPHYRWQSDLAPITSDIESKLVASGQLVEAETYFLPKDSEGKLAVIVSGSVHWNRYRSRWVGVFGRKAGRRSFLGEIVYAEADAPTGPFRKAVTLCDHPNYTFYNPVHHEFLDQGSSIFFEGTYTAEFSGNPDKTPLYNYNQLLYKVDLSDPRLAYAH